MELEDGISESQFVQLFEQALNSDKLFQFSNVCCGNRDKQMIDEKEPYMDQLSDDSINEIEQQDQIMTLS